MSAFLAHKNVSSAKSFMKKLDAFGRSFMNTSMVVYIRHLIFDLKSKLLFYFDLFSFQNHFWFHFDFNIQFHSNLFSFQNHFHHGIFPPNTIFLICFIYFFHFKAIFAMAYIRQMQIYFETQRSQFHFDFTPWYISAILCLFYCSMAYIRQWGTPFEYRDFGMLATEWYIYNVRVHSFCSKRRNSQSISIFLISLSCVRFVSDICEVSNNFH